MCSRTDREDVSRVAVRAITPTIQEFNGERFYRYDGEKRYFRRPSRRGEQYLHRVVWMFYHGDIQPGYHIHHIDGDRSNNQPSNLELVPSKKHHQLHYQADKEAWKLARKAGLCKARDAAKEWHKSEEGRSWHRRHYANVAEKLHEGAGELVCLWCKKPFMAGTKRSLFCSRNCKTRHRYHAKTDHEQRICKNCGQQFEANKYASTAYCSRKCSAAANGKKRAACGEG